MTLKERITEDMKAAMRASEKERLSTIRLVQAAIKQREVDERITLDDTQVLVVLEKMVKQRKESIAQFKAGNRPDLVDKEAAELAVLESYLPQRLGGEEIDAEVARIVAETGASGPADMGKAMAAAKARLAGKADMALVSAAVKRVLSR